MIRRRVIGVLGLWAFGAVAGCEVDSYFDPSKTGRFEYTPTTIPILERIDVIEREPDPWARATHVTPEDLVPSDLTYRISAGDTVRVEIFELLVTGQIWQASQRLDASGTFRLPAPLGDVPAAGLTPQEFQDELVRLVDERVIQNPVVNVFVEDGAGFTYTMYGGVQGTGLYSLRRADFRLLDALAQSGPMYQGVQKIYIIRQVPLTEGPTVPSKPQPSREPPDIEDLIKQLESPGPAGTTGQAPPPPPAKPSTPATQPPKPPASTEQKDQPPVDIEQLIKDLEKTPGTAPGALADEGAAQAGAPEPVPAPAYAQPAAPATAPAAPAPPRTPVTRRDRYVYDQKHDEWVLAPRPGQEPASAKPPEEAPAAPKIAIERVIEVPYEKLKQGDSSYNVVIKPNDRIYVKEPQSGVVYLDGETLRPGVYSFPPTGKMTLSRLVAAAGGPGPLSIPSRVDLTRIVGENREATIRLNLAAIRQRTEPDLYLRPDDHIIIGTSFVAYPLAIFRSGLRMTYGFGFIYDRNFAYDVFPNQR